MSYSKTTWVQNNPPYINATNLNKIEQGVEDAHTLAASGTVNNISALKSLSSASLSSGDIRYVTGYYSTGDGGGGPFYWDGATAKSVTASAATDLFSSTAHGFYHAQQVRLYSLAPSSPGVDTSTNYYVMWQSANTFKLASSLTNALAGTAVNVTSDITAGYANLADDGGTVILLNSNPRDGRFRRVFEKGEDYKVRSFGAKGDRSQDDQPYIQKAINAAAATYGMDGSTTAQGTKVRLQGVHQLNNPIVLPRTGGNFNNSVQLEGESRDSTVLEPTSAFPDQSGVIEWDSRVTQAWNQRIAKIRFHLANCPKQINAIRHRVVGTQTIEQDTWTEWLQLDLQDLYIGCQNAYQDVLIKLENGCRQSHHENIFADPFKTSNEAATYDTLLYDIGYQWSSPAQDPAPGFDSVGFFDVTLDNIHTTPIAGGFSALFKGRAYHTNFLNCFCNGGRTRPQYHFINSHMCELVNCDSEGNASNPYKFEKSRSITVRQYTAGPTYPSLTYRQWSASTSFPTGQRVVPTGLHNATAGARNLYYTSGGGTSGGSEPTWPASGTVSDGSITWTTGTAAVANGIELVNSHEITFIDRWAVSGNPPFSNRSTLLANVDSLSTRNRFEHTQITVPTGGTIDTEVNLGTASQNNRIEARDPATGILHVRPRGFAWRDQYGIITTGRYYGSSYNYSVQMNAAAVASGSLYCTPVFLPDLASYDRMWVKITVAGGAGTFFRMGIYAADALTERPGALIFDSGNKAADAVAEVTHTITQTLAAGKYWLAFLSNSTPTVRTLNPTGAPFGLSDPPSASIFELQTVKTGVTFGALPNPHGTVSFWAGSAPDVMLRAA